MIRLLPKVGCPHRNDLSFSIFCGRLGLLLGVDFVVGHRLKGIQFVTLYLKVRVSNYQAVRTWQVCKWSWYQQVWQLNLEQLELLLNEENCAIN